MGASILRYMPFSAPRRRNSSLLDGVELHSKEIILIEWCFFFPLL